MNDLRTKLTIKYDNNGTFSDLSDSLVDFLRDEETLTLSSTTDYLYLGLDKPFGAAFVHMTTVNTNTNTLAAEYWNGTAWIVLALIDETLGFTRDGFVFWDKSSMKATTIDTVEKFYIRLRPSADHSATTYRGLNLLFSDDHSLKSEFFEITNSELIPSGESSHIGVHVSARGQILQELRKKSYATIQSDGDTRFFDQWDLIDIFEIKQAATYLALSTIFFNLSDDLDDHWWTKHKSYKKKYEQSFALAMLSVDLDDDGVDDEDEIQRQVKVMRWNR